MSESEELTNALRDLNRDNIRLREWNRQLHDAAEDCRRREEQLREVVAEYADHQSWRCGHPDRYPHDPDCPCGLVATLTRLGIEAFSA